MSFLPKILGRNWDFPKGSVWGGSHFSKCLGRKGFGEEFEFSDFGLGGSLIFDNLQQVKCVMRSVNLISDFEKQEPLGITRKNHLGLLERAILYETVSTK